MFKNTLLAALLLTCSLSAQLPAPVYPPIATNPVGTVPFAGAGWSAWCWQPTPPLQCTTQPTFIYGDGAIPNQFVKWSGWCSFGMTDGNAVPTYAGFFNVWWGLLNDPWVPTAMPTPLFNANHNLSLVPAGVSYVTIPCTHTWQGGFSHQNYAGFQLPPSPLLNGLTIYGQSMRLDANGQLYLGGAVRSPVVP